MNILWKDIVFLKLLTNLTLPGVLIAKKKVFKNPVPGGCGGGTVLYVSLCSQLAITIIIIIIMIIIITIIIITKILVIF